VNGLVEHFRNISTAVITKTADFIETSEIIKSRYLDYIDKFSEGDLLRALAFLTKSQNELRNSQNQKIKVEITLAHLIGLEKTSTITELLRNVDETKLEEQKKKVDIESKPSNNEILLTQNRIDDKKALNKYETPHSILPSPSSKPKKKKDLPDNSADISLQAIKENWEKFKEEITRERFTLGPLLEHCNPISLKENNLTIAADNEEDIQILSGEVEFLTKKYRTYYNIKINMKFTLKKRLTVDSNGKENDASRLDNDKYKDHPLIKSIIQELGGREIK
jgi:DNA polymerase III gamma/tau subunit